MNRRFHKTCVILISAAILSTGCTPKQPFFFMEDGDHSHYLGKAAEIEMPITEVSQLDEVALATRPFTSDNPPTKEDTWGLTLEDTVHFTLKNSKIIRNLNTATRVNGTQPPPVSDGILRTTNGAQVSSALDIAIQESDPNTGIEAALSQFDAQFQTSVTWNKNDRRQNSNSSVIASQLFRQDAGAFSAEINKRNATGGRFFARNQTAYDQNNNGFRAENSDWNTQLEFGFVQPLLRDFGVQINRIAGPRAQGFGTSDRARTAGQGANGVMIARINSDQRLVDFEVAVRDLVSNTETAYWELYFAYRNLDAVLAGRNGALATWRKVYALYVVGAREGEADKEAQAREQYFLFKGQVQRGLWTLYSAENRLRFIMGLAANDGRMIRPVEEPTTADTRKIYRWEDVVTEAMIRSPELRRQKWEVQRRELELIASRNLLLPQLDVQAIYRYRGLGDSLLDPNASPSDPAPAAPLPVTAFGDMAAGRHQEWQVGFGFYMPLGFRREKAAVRNAELTLVKEKAIHREKELELSHQLADAYRELDNTYLLTQVIFNRRVAAKDQVNAVETAYEQGAATVDLLLDAQRRLADADSAYFRGVVDYNLAIRNLELRKGSLLEYNDINLAEGPWPNKAVWDALRRSRERDASMYLDYGFTRPAVISGGPYRQHGGRVNANDGASDGGNTELWPEAADEEEAADDGAIEVGGNITASRSGRLNPVMGLGTLLGDISGARNNGQSGGLSGQRGYESVENQQVVRSDRTATVTTRAKR
jgi:outer membrane protein TolC